jgi:bifunctional oligoribonuclease and PAP phosphatase NrnA
MNPEWTKTLARIEAADQLFLVTHERPDPDGIGAALGLAEALEQRGKTVRIFAPDPVPPPYRFLRGWERVEVAPKGKTPKGRPPDLVVLVDANLISRVGEWPKAYETICIDHHIETAAAVPGIIDAGAASASELIVELLEPLGARLSQDMAHNLYTGILFDTRSFRFIQGRSRSLAAAARLLTEGVETEAIFEALFASMPRGFLDLCAQFLGELQFELDGALVWGMVTLDDCDRHGVERALVQELLPFMQMVRGVRVAVLYREMDKGKHKASLRSKGHIDIRSVAELDGGGGHRNASGVTLEDLPEEHMARVLPILTARIQEERQS